MEVSETNSSVKWQQKVHQVTFTQIRYFIQIDAHTKKKTKFLTLLRSLVSTPQREIKNNH